MIVLDGSSLTLSGLMAIAHDRVAVGLTADARQRVRAARALVDAKAAADEPAYRINTGFGSLSDVRIPRDQEKDFAFAQARLIDGSVLQVGRSTNSREVLLEPFRRIFFFVMTPVILFGIATNYVVEHTARHACDMGYRVVVVRDACSAATAEAHDASLKALAVLAEIRTARQVVRGFGAERVGGRRRLR